MPWFPQPQGISPAEANAGFTYHFPELNSALLRPVNPIGDATQDAIQAVAGIMEQRRRDQIANQLLAAGPDLPGGKEMPDFGGGTQGLAASEMLRKQLRDQADLDYRQAKADKLTQDLVGSAVKAAPAPAAPKPASAPSDAPHGIYTVFRDGYGYVTPGQALEIDRAHNPKAGKPDTVGDFIKRMGGPVPGPDPVAGTAQNVAAPADNVINSEEAYNALPSGSTYVDGRTGKLMQKK